MKRFSIQPNIRKSIYRATHWEAWHWLVKYIPMIPFWIAHCIRARSPWFFTAANPTLTFGGYEGESKTEMYKLLPENTYPKSVLIPASMPASDIENLYKSSDFSFPLAVKPDVGRMGLMFRKLNSLDELVEYHQRMKVDYILQEFITLPLEVSVFYYRFPNKQHGTITGFVKKECLQVTGDGISSLDDLMSNYPRVQFRLDEMRVKHAFMLKQIIPRGHKYVLSEALNLSRGGQLISLEDHKDERLLKIFDHLSHTANFYFGRYDIKCQSIEDLKDGKNFSILEFNGSGAEPHHVYGNGNSFSQALTILLAHWSILYRISVENNINGIEYWSFRRGLQHMRRARGHVKLLKELEFSTPDLTTDTELSRVENRNIVLHNYELT
jgi:hypothetical protein